MWRSSSANPNSLSHSVFRFIILQTQGTTFNFSGWLWWTFDPSWGNYDPDIGDLLAKSGNSDVPVFPPNMIFYVLSLFIGRVQTNIAGIFRCDWMNSNYEFQRAR